MGKWLDGKKAYVVMAVGVIVLGLEQMGIITGDVVDLVNNVLVFLGIGAIRHGIAKK